MTDFIQFGLNALGFIVATILCLIAFGIVWGILAGMIEALQKWADRNGWNG